MNRTSLFAHLLSATLLVAASATPATAGSFLQGPVEARVLSVLDGDTFLAEAHVWPGQFVRVNIRIRGIDAPEMKSRCRDERNAAQAARKRLVLLLAGDRLAISNIGGAKYYGRVLADVATAHGQDVGQALLDQGVVRAYGGGKRGKWCR